MLRERKEKDSLKVFGEMFYRGELHGTGSKIQGCF